VLFAARPLYNANIVQVPQTERESILVLVRERIVAYAASRIGKEAAEDLAQETMMLLNEKYAHLDSREDLVPVAVRIMQFKIRAYRRSARRDYVQAESVPLSDENTPDPEHEARFQQLREQLLKAIERLGGRCQRLFLLKLEGYNFIEIKEKMGANSVDTVYTWDYRCRRDLRKLISPPGEQA
jgi:RNA polymerase sigma-70 factor (ECF subfamily)